MKRVAIIGGGISGLSAAYFLQKKSNLEISLFESSSRLGGVIETQNSDGMVLELGPDCFLSKKPAARDLCKAIGLSQELIPTREEFRRSYIYQKKQLMQMPAGFYLMAPGKISTLMKMPHLSWPGKFRAGMDLFIPRSKKEGDESVAGFMRRRLGREAFERIGQPMVGGIYGGDPEKLSMRATLPQFPEMEKKYGSVIRGLCHEQNQAHETASGPRYSLFLSLRQGIEQMVLALAKEASAVKIHTACPIQKLDKTGGVYQLRTPDGRCFEADAVLLAVPSYHAARLLEGLVPELARELHSIEYESVATVNLIYRKEDIPEKFKGVGFVVPRIENTQLSACTYSSLKFAGRVPEDLALLRGFVGGALYRQAFELDDKAMEEMVRRELKAILGLTARPQRVVIRRYRNAMPQYHVGHLEKIAVIRRHQKALPGLFLTGNAYEGIGIPDCISQAETQTQELLDYLGH